MIVAVNVGSHDHEATTVRAVVMTSLLGNEYLAVSPQAAGAAAERRCFADCAGPLLAEIDGYSPWAYMPDGELRAYKKLA